MHRIECFHGAAVRGNGIPARIAIGTVLQIGLGLFEQGLRFIQLLRSHALRARVARRFDGLARIAHLLHRSSRTGPHADAHERQRESLKRPLQWTRQ